MPDAIELEPGDCVQIEMPGHPDPVPRRVSSVTPLPGGRVQVEWEDGDADEFYEDAPLVPCD
jgi:hypothetical protein